MLTHYREIFYGLLFGIGMALIDVAMHAVTEDTRLWEELVRPGALTFFYRVLFLLFGVTLGWLLWHRNRRERDFRQLAATLDRFHRHIAGPAALIHTKLQVLLTRDDLALPTEAETIIQSVYEHSQQIQSAAKDWPPVQTDSH